MIDSWLMIVILIVYGISIFAALKIGYNMNRQPGQKDDTPSLLDNLKTFLSEKIDEIKAKKTPKEEEEKPKGFYD